MKSRVVHVADVHIKKSVTNWHQLGLKVEKTKLKVQSEAAAFCSQRLLLHTFTSLFDTSATFNMNIQHCDIIYLSENKEKHNTSPLKQIHHTLFLLRLTTHQWPWITSSSSAAVSLEHLGTTLLYGACNYCIIQQHMMTCENVHFLKIY